MIGAIVMCRQECLSHCHADAVAESLSERPCGRFYARCPMIFGVSGGGAIPLAEVLDGVQRQIVAGQVEQCVQQHRAMSRREDKSITVRPLWILWVVAQM